ncbi:hypothetical protein roselon_03305 [Roseibacterium elongatum DSM 19469]|uniref:Sulfotransferase family protein n=1 Tax=Roseicyclus elongatus DSM 19469 TaxID=1294273 RepID=W8RW75_9RHOB|nr:sulfotransferase family protein [Roseibacterium elongatum]AHM05563.1 hypothetical protein roselon_03305 [Roseibacterium elongatum DSM 19469]
MMTTTDSHTNAAPAEKVFVIGLSKTGTTTMKDMLTTLGYRVRGPSKTLLAKIRAGHPEAALPVMEEYDAFEDWPWPLVYRQAHDIYGDRARFILTVRRDEDTWFRSIEQHGYGTGLTKSMKDAYGYYRPFGRKAEFTKLYRDHNAAARAFFADKPHLFTEFCLEQGDSWDKLCPFLGHPVPTDMPTPHRNKTARGKRALNRKLNALIAPIYARLP